MRYISVVLAHRFKSSTYYKWHWSKETFGAVANLHSPWASVCAAYRAITRSAYTVFHDIEILSALLVLCEVTPAVVVQTKVFYIYSTYSYMNIQL